MPDDNDVSAQFFLNAHRFWKSTAQSIDMRLPYAGPSGNRSPFRINDVWGGFRNTRAILKTVGHPPSQRVGLCVTSLSQLAEPRRMFSGAIRREHTARMAGDATLTRAPAGHWRDKEYVVWSEEEMMAPIINEFGEPSTIGEIEL